MSPRVQTVVRVSRVTDARVPRYMYDARAYPVYMLDHDMYSVDPTRKIWPI